LVYLYELNVNIEIILMLPEILHMLIDEFQISAHELMSPLEPLKLKPKKRRKHHMSAAVTRGWKGRSVFLYLFFQGLVLFIREWIMESSTPAMHSE